MGKAVETKAMLERAGIACPLVTGGSTGTYRFDSENPGITELQPGSFVFMDMEYGTIGGPDGTEYRDFKNAMTVVTTVVSRPPGLPSLTAATRRSPPTGRSRRSRSASRRELRVGGRRARQARVSNASRDVKLGDRLEFIPPHIDPTVNLYDNIYALRGDRVEAVWPIAARGKSQ